MSATEEQKQSDSNPNETQKQEPTIAISSTQGMAEPPAFSIDKTDLCSNNMASATQKSGTDSIDFTAQRRQEAVTRSDKKPVSHSYQNFSRKMTLIREKSKEKAQRENEDSQVGS